MRCNWCRQPCAGPECEDCRHRRDELDSMKASGEVLAVVFVLMLMAVALSVVIGA